jgi:hypothetical protein
MDFINGYFRFQAFCSKQLARRMVEMGYFSQSINVCSPRIRRLDFGIPFTKKHFRRLSANQDQQIAGNFPAQGGLAEWLNVWQPCLPAGWHLAI